MRDMVPAWFSALLWRGAEAAFVVAVAVTCGSYVENSAQARQAAWQARMSPNSITPLSASLTEEAPRSQPHYGLMAAPNCAPQLTLAARDGALIVLTLQAACAADGRVEITHAGMTFAARMPIGRPLRLTLPALDAAGEVLAVLPGGMQARAAVALPDLRALHRFAVTAPTAQALQLQGDPEAGGALTLLGDADLAQPLLAQVYTYPAKGAAQARVEVTSSAVFCGQSLIGQTISSRFGRADATALRVDLPECGARPVVMHLKNLDQDVKVASR
ncbi:hypothetical protein NX862_00160 [Rhodobacter sp. KR11]|uniref:hypothetical protein n=1 Tax=Rhodobacter sp. KR11 TaxID=2974588 RepID=UPI002223E816|nr:hypothetical protein [Rhodobacter sp. KR11]MCW1917158.1 hypothetical protein [Rhodobacter sp. KR11]